LQHDGLPVALSILPDAFFRLCRIVVHVQSEVAPNLSASLQKTSVVPARFLICPAELTVKNRRTPESRYSALIWRKPRDFFLPPATSDMLAAINRYFGTCDVARCLRA
jgi:hypothetical protein